MKIAMRALASAVFAVTAWAGVAPAQDIQAYVVSNRTHGYEIAYPSTWQVATPEGLDFVFISPDQSAFCLASGTAIPDLANVPEAEIRKAMSQSLGEKFWTDIFFNTVPNTKFLKTASIPNHPGNWPVQFVLAQGTPDMGGGPSPMVFAGITTFKSATNYLVMCLSQPDKFEANQDGIGVILMTLQINK